MHINVLILTLFLTLISTGIEAKAEDQPEAELGQIEQFEAAADRVREVYRLAAKKDCKGATYIRKNWSVARCRKLKSVANLQVQTLGIVDETAFLLLSVDLDSGVGAETQTIFVTTRSIDGQWFWDDIYTRDRTEAGISTIQQYKKFVLEGVAKSEATTVEVAKPIVKQPSETSVAPPEPSKKVEPPSDLEQVVTRPDADLVPAQDQSSLESALNDPVDGVSDQDNALYGTETVDKVKDKPPASAKSALAACWSNDELRFNPSEKRIVKTPISDARRTPVFELANVRHALAKNRKQSVRYVSTDDKVIALTFDFCERLNEITGYDGPIVEYLRNNRIAATLYMGGKWMHSHPERSMQLIADPLFELGNHGWTHGNFRMLNAAEIDDQIQHTQTQFYGLKAKLLERQCAVPFAKSISSKEMTTFRFPYGTCKANGLQAVNKAGLSAIQWNIVTGDPWKKQTARAIANIVISRAKPGAIVVMHGNGRGWNTRDALEIFIPRLRAMGYRFITVSDMMKLGAPVAVDQCYENKLGDNVTYDRFGKGTGE